jgi:hypothetical protein
MVAYLVIDDEVADAEGFGAYEQVARLPAGARFPVTLAFAHERPGERYGPQIRCRVLLGPPADRAILDITPERFDRLPWNG